ncbi:hypothetical protein EW146_g699 [Bondarzewia mesenterica]|uniref:Uncharacterized protein n=1 Tax=Bondarzewia mesenterica TaxID=1095465 RepID=A0A4S4M849_9AGAM|nr:hypothetical protein EW146_g699 [Bondarzewia mesenterica]
MGHGAQELSGIGDDFVTRFSLDMADEADTTGVLLKLVRVETLAGGHSARPGRRVALDGIKTVNSTGRSVLLN